MREHIVHVWRHATHPLRELWKWAKKPERDKRRLRRWQALADFANRKRRQNRALGRIVQAKAWTERRTIYRKKHRHLRKQIKDRKPDPGTPCVSYPARPWNPYGKPVATWIVPWLDKSREAGWHGVLNSGWRSPEYSEQLCYSMCGAPSCPGRCAGRSSNHTQCAEPAGAVDVSDYYNFAAIQRKIGSGLYNALGAADPVHFSRTGR